MFCRYCGTQVADNARFCRHCGAAISTPSPAPQPAPVIPSTPMPDPIPETTPTPVAVPETVSTPVSALEETVAPVKKKKKKKKLLPLICILALVAVAAVAAVFFFGKQTVYLVTESVSTSMNGPVTTMRYEYDKAGRITKYEYAIEYPDTYGYAYDMKFEASYEYDKKGNLISAEFEHDDEVIEVEYVYEKNVLVGFEVDESEGSFADSDSELKVKCDDKGRFKYVAILEDGEELQVWEFKYHNNGTIKESHSTSSHSETISRFNEDGQTTETLVYWYDELQYRVVYSYDQNGRQTMMKQYDSDDELLIKWELEYTFKKDKLTGLTMQFEAPDGDGEMIEAGITFECEWDGLECEVTVDEIDGDEEVLEQMGFGDLDLVIRFEVDKNGNILNTEISVDDEVISSTTNEYEAFKVSRRYKEVNVRTDPLYLLFLING